MRILKICKINTFLVGMMMMAIILCCSTQVQAAQDGDYTYTVTDTKAQITKYTGAGGVITIPSTLNGASVTSIGEAAFDRCTGLTSIILPPGVTSISNGAFYQCTGLTTIRFNSATTTIYDSEYTIHTATKIIGYDPSSAKDYATKYHRTFEAIGYTAVPLVQIGINPNYGDSAGIFIGLKDIRDTSGKIVSDAKLAGYQIDVHYDHNQATVLDVVDEAQMGQFALNNEVDTIRASVTDIVYQGTNNFEKLFFVPLALTGTSATSTNVLIKLTSFSNQNLNQIDIPDVTLTFQRGKILNEATQKAPSIKDTVAGLQYLARSVEAGIAPGQVNIVNMASILPPESGATGLKPSVKNVIALMQKLVGLRDINFKTVDIGSSDILIGGNLELTGNLSTFGQTAKNAVELAFQQVNDQGGILNGRKLKFITEDNKSNNNEVVTAATKLITQDKVIGIIGPMTSPGTIAEIPVATENSVPIITPSGSAPELTVNGVGQVNKWIYRACFIDPDQANATAQFALGDQINAQTAAVMIDQNSAYSQGLAAAFIQSFTNGGGQIIHQEQYVAGSDDFSTILETVQNTHPDIVYLPGYYQDAGKIVKQARDLGMNMPFIGGDGWGSAEIYNIAGVQAMNNTYYTDHVAFDDLAMAQFITDYQAKYGEKPDAFAALAFDSAKMVVKAIEIAGNTDTEKMRVALENIKDLQGVSGNITVDPTTHNLVKSVIFMENIEGKAVFLTKIDPLRLVSLP